MNNELALRIVSQDDHLEHHGIMGMKWGIRRYQHADGTLTAAGRKRYGSAAPGNPVNKVKARDAARILNDREEEASTIRSNILKSRKAQAKLGKKIEKAEKKGNQEKVEELKRLKEPLISNELKNMLAFAAIKSNQSDLIDIFTKSSGLNITMKDASHNTKPAFNKITDAILYGGLISGIRDVRAGDLVDATKFKVKKSKTGVGKLKDKRKYTKRSEDQYLEGHWNEDAQNTWKNIADKL